MSLELLFRDLVPFIVFALMLGMGLSLRIQDFKRLFLYPKPVIVGVLGQLFFLPSLAFALALLFNAPPAIAAGAMLLAACPGGVTSNAYVFASGCDVGLSITLTAISSVVTVLTIPLITWLTMNYFYDSGEVATLPPGEIMRPLMLITALPLAIGMSILHRWPQYAKQAAEFARRMSLFLLLVIIVGVTLGTVDVLKQHLLTAAALTIALNVTSLAAGYGLGRLFQFPRKQVRTLTFEIGVQNIGLAVVVGVTLLEQRDLAIFAVVYALFMKITALTLVFLWRPGGPMGEPAHQASG